MDYFQALILGIVEGLTEFLPISSTGHMILTTSILGVAIDEFMKSFLVIIQLGSILAVVFVLWRRLVCGIDIYLKLAAAFVPTGLIGLLASQLNFKDYLFNGFVVAFMLILGGVAFIFIEKKYTAKNTTKNISFKQAFLIGVFQALAIIPGTSRSGASIIGGLLLGLDRKSATEFSFLLALPTILVATAYDIYKSPEILSSFFTLTQNAQLSQSPAVLILIGFCTAFFVAIFVIKFFLNFISKFSFIPFGIYRILLGLLFFALFFGKILSTNMPF